MKGSTKTYMTAGVALVGAGVIATSPIAPIPANYADASRSYDVALMAAAEPTDAQREIRAAMALLEGFETGGTLEAFIEGTLAAFNRSGAEAVNDYTPVTGVVDRVGRIGQGFVASGLRLGATALAPLRLIELAQAIADGNGAEGFAALVENIVDAPLWVVDPSLFALRDALPAPLGGPDGLFANIRDQLWRLTEEINAGLRDPGALVQRFVEGTILAFERAGNEAEYRPVDGPIDGFSRVTEGAIASALRLAAATVLGPVGVVRVAAAVAQGKSEEALAAVEDLVDGPLWAVDPALYGLRDALPTPLGGPDALVENFRNGLWSATEQINGAIRDIVNRGQAATEADATPPAETFSEPSISSTPDSQARRVNLSKQESKENELDDLPQQDQRKDSKLDSTSSGLLGSKEEKPLTSARNLVRNSLNFSPGAGRTGQNPTGEASSDVVKTTTQEETDTTQPTNTTQPTDTTKTTDTTQPTNTTQTTDTKQNTGTAAGTAATAGGNNKKPGGSERGGSGGDK